MTNSTAYVTRTTGSLVEELQGVGDTRIGKAIEVDAALAERLLKDGTGRFRKSTKAEVDAVTAEAKATVEARLKAANTPPTVGERQ